MTDDPPDLQALARRYLDLWQEQLGSMARDPAVSDALARSFSLMTQGLADAIRPARDPSATAASEQTGEGHADPAPTDTATTATGASGAASAGRASGDAGPVDDDMAARIERLEHRVALLEAALGGLLSGASRPQG